MRSLFALIGFGVVAYGFFFFPLGSRTAWQHCRAIAATDEAQELGREAAQAAERFEGQVEEEIERLGDAGVPDGSSD